MRWHKRGLTAANNCQEIRGREPTVYGSCCFPLFPCQSPPLLVFEVRKEVRNPGGSVGASRVQPSPHAIVLTQAVRHWVASPGGTDFPQTFFLSFTFPRHSVALFFLLEERERARNKVETRSMESAPESVRVSKIRKPTLLARLMMRLPILTSQHGNVGKSAASRTGIF